MHSSPIPTSTSEKSDDVSADFEPSGLLIANDSDYRRAQLLVHNTARLPSTAIMVTNLDVSNFPVIRIPEKLPSVQTSNAKDLSTRPLRFHRILSDVPCSGDGTLRKNARIWQTWSPMDGNGLHRLAVLPRSSISNQIYPA